MAESTAELDGARALRILREGTIRPRGLMPDCSNYTYLAQVRGHDGDLLAVYKPASGEMPLDDFPDGTLGKREVAAYLVSEALGWRVVPPTVYRADGPHGPGSLQQFIAADLSQHYFTMMPKRAEDFRMMAAFDCIVNNADRKSGHCLLDDTGHIWGVDNGLTFHPLPKLRTVIWEFGGEAVPQTLVMPGCWPSASWATSPGSSGSINCSPRLSCVPLPSGLGGWRRMEPFRTPARAGPIPGPWSNRAG